VEEFILAISKKCHWELMDKYEREEFCMEQLNLSVLWDIFDMDQKEQIRSLIQESV
jgi:hypothetical protein